MSIPPASSRYIVLSKDRFYVSTKEESKILKRQHPPLVQLWGWEISTFILGTGTFVSILLLLLIFRDRDPKALPLGNHRIQLTAVIAALAQVAQSAFLVPISQCIGQLKWEWFQRSKNAIGLEYFDEASRGPNGSLRLLFYFSWRQRLVSLGALATILMLLFPTFVQQSVQIGPKPFTEFNSTLVSIPRSVNLLRNANTAKLPTSFMNSALYTNDTTYDTIDTDLTAALINGIIGLNMLEKTNQNSDSDVSVLPCDGNCTVPSYNTLALCFSTSDISQQIVKSDGYVSLPALGDSQGGVWTVDTTPLFLSATHQYYAESNSTSTPIPPPTVASHGTNLPNLAEIYYFFYDVCKLGTPNIENANPARYTALRGQIQFCIQNQTSSSTKDQLGQTKHLSSTASLNWYRSSKNNQTTLCTKLGPEKEDFCVAESIMESLSAKMWTIFTGSANFSDATRSDIEYESEWAPFLTRSVFGGASDTQPDCSGYNRSEPSLVFGQMGNVSQPEHGFQMALRNLTRSLTDAFQYKSNKQINGIYEHDVLVLQVDFRWFILPAMLYGIIIIFVVTTLIATRDTPMWKSSPLPLLRAMERGGDTGSVEEFKKKAKTSRVELISSGNGWQLVESSGMETGDGSKYD